MPTKPRAMLVVNLNWIIQSWNKTVFVLFLFLFPCDHVIINPPKLITSLAEERMRKRKRKEKTQSGLPKTVCFQFIQDCTRKRKEKKHSQVCQRLFAFSLYKTAQEKYNRIKHNQVCQRLFALSL